MSFQLNMKATRTTALPAPARIGHWRAHLPAQPRRGDLARCGFTTTSMVVHAATAEVSRRVVLERKPDRAVHPALPRRLPDPALLLSPRRSPVPANATREVRCDCRVWGSLLTIALIEQAHEQTVAHADGCGINIDNIPDNYLLTNNGGANCPDGYLPNRGCIVTTNSDPAQNTGGAAGRRSHGTSHLRRPDRATGCWHSAGADRPAAGNAYRLASSKRARRPEPPAGSVDTRTDERHRQTARGFSCCSSSSLPAQRRTRAKSRWRGVNRAGACHVLPSSAETSSARRPASS